MDATSAARKILRAWQQGDGEVIIAGLGSPAILSWSGSHRRAWSLLKPPRDWSRRRSLLRFAPFVCFACFVVNRFSTMATNESRRRSASRSRRPKRTQSPGAPGHSHARAGERVARPGAESRLYGKGVPSRSVGRRFRKGVPRTFRISGAFWCLAHTCARWVRPLAHAEGAPVSSLVSDAPTGQEPLLSPPRVDRLHGPLARLTGAGPVSVSGSSGRGSRSSPESE
jgi:hypothetical protein